jgi:hypothetical protein
MYSADAVIECACGGKKIIHGQPALEAYWRHRVGISRRWILLLWECPLLRWSFRTRPAATSFKRCLT